MPNSPVAQGETIAQKYQVEKVIGEGGMGLVVAAWHVGLQQRVAIKFLHADAVADQGGASERFRREARAAAKIRSEHVCRVLDVGTLDNGIPYMVMEYLEGHDLATELDQKGKLPASEAIDYVLQACEALAEAHVAGIVHRDLKPANLFLANRADGSRAIKVLDFGVSKSRADAGISHLSLTKTASLIGSPIYMSPEQLNSAKDVDARTDIWALGSILYELVTGRTPFNGETIPQLVNAVLNSEPPSFEALGLSVPAGLDAVIRRALAKDRELRYASVAEFTQELAPLAPAHSAISVDRVARVLQPGSRSGSAVPGGSQVPVVPAAAMTPQPVERDSTPMPATSARTRLAWALVLAALLGAGLWLLRSQHGSETATPPAPPLAAAPPAQADLQDAGVHNDKKAAAVEPAPSNADQPPAAPEQEPAAAANTEAAPPAAAAPAEVLPQGVDVPAQAPAPAVTKVATPAAATPRPRAETKKPPRPAAETPASSISDFGGRR